MKAHDNITIKMISDHLDECYIYAKKVLGPEFETIMADISAEVLVFQGKCKEGTSFAIAAMALSTGDRDELTRILDDDYDPDLPKLIKASITWYLIDQRNGGMA